MLIKLAIIFFKLIISSNHTYRHLSDLIPGIYLMLPFDQDLLFPACQSVVSPYFLEKNNTISILSQNFSPDVRRKHSSIWYTVQSVS